MPDCRARPIVFLDFDNTVTLGDVLDRVIERYSKTDAWRGWEAEWQAGRMSTVDCLRLQIGNLRASPRMLQEFVARTEIDLAFPELVAWAHSEGIELCIVSDNFAVLIDAILKRHGVPALTVFANELHFSHEHLEAHFPYRDPECLRCAHCKAQHLRATKSRPRIYVGDGLSDLCPARVAELVFAKDLLAIDLERQGIAFHPFRGLEDVLRYLQACHFVPPLR